VTTWSQTASYCTAIVEDVAAPIADAVDLSFSPATVRITGRLDRPAASLVWLDAPIEPLGEMQFAVVQEGRWP
jgi:hypothetical protein